MSIEKPTDLLKKLVITERILMTAGITGIDPRVRAAMSLPLLPPNDPQFQQILSDSVDGIRYLLQTTNRYTFAINGPISLAFETAISNIVDSNQAIMVAIHGVKGERMAKTVRALGYKLLRLKTEPGQLIDKTSFKNALETHKPKILFLCHGDDSVGTLQPLRGIGAICHDNDCLFIVDASCTVGTVPLNIDQMEIDVLMASTEYALGLSPGLSLISFNLRATDLIKKRRSDKNVLVCYSMDFDLLAQTWGLSDENLAVSKYMSHFAPPISLIYGLRESLALIAEEGLNRMITRHMKTSLTAQKEMTKIGLKFLVTDEHKRLGSVLVILVPDSIKREAIINYFHKYYDIEISEGLSPIDKVWRIGLLGPNANRGTVKLMVSVARDAIEKAKNQSTPKSSLSSPSTISNI